MKPRLALFDLDHTLLHGDSDVLWCEFLMDEGVLERAAFAARNADMEARYRDGTVDAAAFANFYVSTQRLAQRPAAAGGGGCSGDRQRTLALAIHTQLPSRNSRVSHAA